MWQLTLLLVCARIHTQATDRKLFKRAEFDGLLERRAAPRWPVDAVGRAVGGDELRQELSRTLPRRPLTSAAVDVTPRGLNPRSGKECVLAGRGSQKSALLSANASCVHDACSAARFAQPSGERATRARTSLHTGVLGRALWRLALRRAGGGDAPAEPLATERDGV